MASLLPDYEGHWDPTGVNTQYRLHKVTLLSSSDTVTVPTLADADTPSNSVAELDDGNNDTGATVSASNGTTVTITGGSAGGVVHFMTMHGPGIVNSSVTTG